MQQFKAARKWSSVLVLLLSTLVLAAQEKSGEMDVNINKEEHHIWYTSPWVWIIGAIVFILLLLALLRGTEKKG
jgi:hypothetical protein